VLVACEPLRKALHRVGADRELSCADTVADALALVPSFTGPPMTHQPLPAVPGAVAEARLTVRELCHRRGFAGVAQSAEVVVTELVANALRHGRAPVTLSVNMRRAYVHVAVRDYGPRLPVAGRADPVTGEGGRGLLVVEAFSSVWGVTPARDGKVVWARLRLS
jgi:anti-sigma regulatory factor (Ser/Thr protein kinase)